eukprot:Clim_evm12s243 gene=Clim_evmTU12s243
MTGRSLVLSYHDVALYEEDLATLETPGEWLNDKVIDFAFLYLENNLTETQSQNIGFVGPNMASLMLNGSITGIPQEQIKAMLEPLQLGTKKLIVTAINNAGPGGGGSHWSLVTCYPQEGLAVHFDSQGHSNLSVASSIIGTLDFCLGNSGKTDLQLGDAPQQCNTSDCGIHAQLNAKYVIEQSTDTNSLQPITFIPDEAAGSLVVRNARSEISLLIRTLASEGS